MDENLNLVNDVENNGSESVEPMLDPLTQPPGPSLLAPIIGEDARLVQTLLNDLVQRIQEEKLDIKSSVVDSELKSIAKRAKIKLASVRHDFAQQTKNAEQPSL